MLMSSTSRETVARMHNPCRLAWPRGKRDRIELLHQYVSCFGNLRGTALFLLARLYSPFNGREVRLAVPGYSASVYVRLRTSDITVFTSTFLERQYGWKFTTPPVVIVDAGAYTGLSTVYFATRYPDALIIAVEPSKSNYELLMRNTESFTNVRAVRAALWSGSGSLVLTDPGEGTWGFRVGDSGALTSDKDESVEIDVPAVTITELMRTFHVAKIDLLKVDIEGSEVEVFSNPDPWIRSVEVICLEPHDRFRPGCSRTFFKAVTDFPVELWRGDTVMVARSLTAIDLHAPLATFPEPLSVVGATSAPQDFRYFRTVPTERES